MRKTSAKNVYPSLLLFVLLVFKYENVNLKSKKLESRNQYPRGVFHFSVLLFMEHDQ